MRTGVDALAIFGTPRKSQNAPGRVVIFMCRVQIRLHQRQLTYLGERAGDRSTGCSEGAIRTWQAAGVPSRNIRVCVVWTGHTRAFIACCSSQRAVAASPTRGVGRGVTIIMPRSFAPITTASRLAPSVRAASETQLPIPVVATGIVAVRSGRASHPRGMRVARVLCHNENRPTYDCHNE